MTPPYYCIIVDRSSARSLIRPSRFTLLPRRLCQRNRPPPPCKVNIIFLRGAFYFSASPLALLPPLPHPRYLTRAEVFFLLARVGFSFGKDDCDEQPGERSRRLERLNIVLTSIRYDPAESAYRAVRESERERAVNRINSISCELFRELVRSPVAPSFILAIDGSSAFSAFRDAPRYSRLSII